MPFRTDREAAAGDAGGGPVAAEKAESTAGETAGTEAPVAGTGPVETSGPGGAPPTPPVADPPGSGDEPEPGPRSPLRRVAAVVLTVLAFALVLIALVGPNDPIWVVPAAFLRIPIEGLAGVALLLVLPRRARLWVAAAFGVLLGLLTVLKLFDIGYLATIARPFDPVLDWLLLDDAASLLADSTGPVVAVVALIGAGLLVLGIPVLTALAAVRLTRLFSRHSVRTMQVVALLTVIWMGCALLGAQVVPGAPIASASAAALVSERTDRISSSVADLQGAFDAQIADDPFATVPGEQLLTALRGKDVVVAFVESYGRTVVEGPEYTSTLAPTLEDGSRRLAAAGFGARSGWLTSATAGGYSWLAHSTTMSGLWINTQQRYTTLLGSERLTLNTAFQKAGWRSVGVMPALTLDWPEGTGFYDYDQLYDSRNVGYAGPAFSYATMPDQFSLAALQRAERDDPAGPPIFAEVALVSSHAPWSPIPQRVGWDQVGDGTIYGPMAAQGPPPEEVFADQALLRDSYGRSIAYSVDTLVSYLETYGDDDLVFVVLGDHQPAPFVTGPGAGRDVPITIVSKDPAVMERVADWGWQDGIRPAPDGPVWRMDTFRDRFLTTFR